MASGVHVSAETVASLDEVTKRFGSVTAVKCVSLAFKAGETHALMGENGAGKSTIVRLLAGVLQPDEGTVHLDGSDGVHNPGDALARGVATIYQDRMLVPNLSVAENITLGHEPMSRGALVDRSSQERIARDALLDVRLDIDPATLVGDLSAASQQLVAIARALTAKVRLLILDEPTAALTKHETRNLFDLMARLKDTGVGIIYISHRLDEVNEIADRVSVLKDGALQRTLDASEATESTVVQLMVGRELDELYPTFRSPSPEVAFEVEGLTDREGRFRSASLKVKRGEVVGLAGLDGSGKECFAAALGGDVRVSSGHMLLDGAAYAPHSVTEALARGVAFIPPDRLTEALFSNFSVRETITIATVKSFTRFGFISPRLEREKARTLVNSLRIKGAVEDPIGSLSGGNQQKALFARALCTSAKVFVLAEPTAGVDVGARADIYALIAGLAAEGAAVIVVSSDLMELLGLCHRIAVFSEGEINANLASGEATEEAIVRAQLPRRRLSDTNQEPPEEEEQYA